MLRILQTFSDDDFRYDNEISYCSKISHCNVCMRMSSNEFFFVFLQCEFFRFVVFVTNDLLVFWSNEFFRLDEFRLVVVTNVLHVFWLCKFRLQNVLFWFVVLFVFWLNELFRVVLQCEFVRRNVFFRFVVLQCVFVWFDDFFLFFVKTN